jgi:hypothetical protein
MQESTDFGSERLERKLQSALKNQMNCAKYEA